MNWKFWRKKPQSVERPLSYYTDRANQIAAERYDEVTAAQAEDLNFDSLLETGGFISYYDPETHEHVVEQFGVDNRGDAYNRPDDPDA